jgi:asparaginyl-tRNA synthetase
MRVRNACATAIHSFFQEKGFIWVHTPIITANDCEGAGELFTVTSLDLKKPANFAEDFFGKLAYLTVSGQLQAEVMAMALSNVYTFWPDFAPRILILPVIWPSFGWWNRKWLFVTWKEIRI